MAQAALVRGIVSEELGERVLTPEPLPRTDRAADRDAATTPRALR